MYGQVIEDVFQLLDRQQRLTTLFLLYWYIAHNTDALEELASWASSTCETRPSARRFCELLLKSSPEPAGIEPGTDQPPGQSYSDWIEDQPWYLFTWRDDPTIASMLVMIDAIHARFAEAEAEAHAPWAELWARVTRDSGPIFSFHVLGLPNMASAEDLYVKMNSRGRPLTQFENLKAHLEKTVKSCQPDDVATQFSHNMDVAWSDLMWRVDNQQPVGFDDRFIRYLDYLTQICEWRSGQPAEARLEERVDRAFGTKRPFEFERGVVT